MNKTNKDIIKVLYHTRSVTDDDIWKSRKNLADTKKSTVSESLIEKWEELLDRVEKTSLNNSK